MKASFAEEPPTGSSNGSVAQQQPVFGRHKWQHWFRRWQIRWGGQRAVAAGN